MWNSIVISFALDGPLSCTGQEKQRMSSSWGASHHLQPCALVARPLSRTSKLLQELLLAEAVQAGLLS